MEKIPATYHRDNAWSRKQVMEKVLPISVTKWLEGCKKVFLQMANILHPHVLKKETRAIPLPLLNKMFHSFQCFWQGIASSNFEESLARERRQISNQIVQSCNTAPRHIYEKYAFCLPLGLALQQKKWALLSFKMAGDYFRCSFSAAAYPILK